jgi:hypothetical protein
MASRHTTHLEWIYDGRRTDLLNTAAAAYDDRRARDAR